MCGRITLTVSSTELADVFALYSRPGQFTARYNIAPTQPIAAVLDEPHAPQIASENLNHSVGAEKSPNKTRLTRRQLDHFLWGLIPPWSQDPRGNAPLINARAETVASKPAFRQAFKRRRCLIPASGFFEWDRRGRAKSTPYYIRPRQGLLFAFAGLWEQWNDPAGTGSEVRSCCVITVPSNAEIAEFHDRMPAILAPEDFDTWLDPGNSDTAALQSLLRTRAPDEMEILPVSSFVNTAKNEGARCIERIEPEALLF